MDHFGSTPLHVAAERRLSETVSVLVASGANVNAANQIGNTPLHRACRVGATETARLLCALGADKRFIKEKEGGGREGEADKSPCSPLQAHLPHSSRP